MHKAWRLIALALGMLGFAALLMLAALVAVGAADEMSGHAAFSIENELPGSASTLNGLSSAVIGVANALAYIVIGLMLASIVTFVIAVVVTFRSRKRATETSQPLAERLEALGRSLGELQSEMTGETEALRRTEEQRRRNEALIAMTREQTEEVAQEIRSAASTGSRLQIAIGIAGIVIGIVLSIVIAVLA